MGETTDPQPRFGADVSASCLSLHLSTPDALTARLTWESFFISRMAVFCGSAIIYYLGVTALFVLAGSTIGAAMRFIAYMMPIAVGFFGIVYLAAREPRGRASERSCRKHQCILGPMQLRRIVLRTVMTVAFGLCVFAAYPAVTGDWDSRSLYSMLAVQIALTTGGVGGLVLAYRRFAKTNEQARTVLVTAQAHSGPTGPEWGADG